MRFLLDANLSPRLCGLLRSAGRDTMHVSDVGLLAATDEVIFEYAARHGLVIITADTDFSMLLALRRTAAPSVVLLRRVAELRPDAHGALLIANLPLVMDDLALGAVVSLSPSRLSVRRLPMQSGSDA